MKLVLILALALIVSIPVPALARPCEGFNTAMAALETSLRANGQIVPETPASTPKPQAVQSPEVSQPSWNSGLVLPAPTEQHPVPGRS